MNGTELTLESISRSDPFHARAAALEAAAHVGVPLEALLEIRRKPVGEGLTARDWLQLALDEGRRWLEDAA